MILSFYSGNKVVHEVFEDQVDSFYKYVQYCQDNLKGKKVERCNMPRKMRNQILLDENCIEACKVRHVTPHRLNTVLISKGVPWINAYDPKMVYNESDHAS